MRKQLPSEIMFCADWQIIKRGDMIGYDLEEYPLEILTNSGIGGYEVIHVVFYDTSESQIKDMTIHYAGQNSIRWTMFCYDSVEIPSSALPTTPNKIWKIVKKESETVLYCNGQYVTNITYSDSTTSAACKVMGTRDVDFIMLHTGDSATDFIKKKGMRIDNIM